MPEAQSGGDLCENLPLISAGFPTRPRNQAQFYHPQKGDVLITKKEAAERGWLAEGDKRLSLDGSGPDEVKPLLAALRRVETLYGRGATTTLNACQLELLRQSAGKSLTRNTPPVSALVAIAW